MSDDCLLAFNDVIKEGSFGSFLNLSANQLQKSNGQMHTLFGYRLRQARFVCNLLVTWKVNGADDLVKYGGNSKTFWGRGNSESLKNR